MRYLWIEKYRLASRSRSIKSALRRETAGFFSSCRKGQNVSSCGQREMIAFPGYLKGTRRSMITYLEEWMKSRRLLNVVVGVLPAVAEEILRSARKNRLSPER